MSEITFVIIYLLLLFFFSTTVNVVHKLVCYYTKQSFKFNARTKRRVRIYPHPYMARHRPIPPTVIYFPRYRVFTVNTSGDMLDFFNSLLIIRAQHTSIHVPRGVRGAVVKKGSSSHNIIITLRLCLPRNTLKVVYRVFIRAVA